MAEGYVQLLCEKWDLSSAKSLVASAGEADIRLANPANGRITELSELGEQIWVDRDRIVADASLGDMDEVTFQLWIDEDVDVVYTVRRWKEHGASVRAFVDGLSWAQRTAVARWGIAVGLFWPEVTVFVVDRRGEAEDVVWEEWAGSDLGGAEGVPELLAVRGTDGEGCTWPSGFSVTCGAPDLLPFLRQ